MRYKVVLTNLLALSFATLCHAQTISILAPDASSTNYEGDDYASHVLDNPWDESERRDVGWEENLVGTGASGVRVEDGKFKATYDKANGSFYPLFHGFTGSIFAEGLPGDRTLPRFGRNHPIDTSRYKYLSYKMSVSEHAVASVAWSKTSQIASGGWPVERGTFFDGYYTNIKGFARTGWFTYLLNMADLNSTFGPGLYTGSWSGQVISLRIEPSNTLAGTKLEVDWIRLVDPNSAPQLNLSWDSSNIDNIPNRVVTLAYTTNPPDRTQGSPIAQFPKADPRSFQFPLAALPPGDYYFYLFVHPAGNMNAVITQSGLSAKQTILPASSAYFTSPTQISGEDYATTVLGNPWDMSGADDVANLKFDIWPEIWRQFSAYDFSNGSFNATANAPLPGAVQSDVQVHLAVDSNHPIDTNKYRYVNYKIAVDESHFPTVAEKVNDGWVMRLVGWNHSALDIGVEGDSYLPPAHVVYEGNHAYTYDLWNDTAENLTRGVSWRSNPWLSHLRVDPLEVSIPTRFSLDYVTLNAEPRPDENKIFPASFVIEGDQNADVSLFYDADNSGFDGTLITTLPNLAPGSHTINWDTSNLPQDQKYYLYVTVTTGSSVRKFYSPVPVALGAYTDIAPPVATPEPTLPPSLVSTPPTRSGDANVFSQVILSPSTVKVGENVTFNATLNSGLTARSVKAILLSNGKGYAITLRLQKARSYAVVWKSKLLPRNSKSIYNVSVQADLTNGKKVTKRATTLTVKK